jgi:hypothetical protein
VRHTSPLAKITMLCNNNVDRNIITKKLQSSDPYFKVGLCDSSNPKPTLAKEPKPHKSKVYVSRFPKSAVNYLALGIFFE